MVAVAATVLLFALAVARPASAAPPAPPEAELRSAFAGVKGARIAYASYAPASAASAGIVVRVNGRATTYLQDGELIGDLTRAGLQVFTYDHRGQGLSQRLLADAPEVGHVEAFDDYIEDLRTFVREVVTPRAAGRPVHLVATSTGGLVTLLALTDGRPWPEIGPSTRIVLNVPLVKIKVLGLPHALLRLILMPFAPESPAPLRGEAYVRPPFEGNDVTSDRQRYERFYAVYDQHPETRVGPPSVGWVREAVAAGERLEERMEAARDAGRPLLSQRVLLIQAENDRIVENGAQEALCQAIGRQCQLYVAKGSQHGALIETDAVRGGVIKGILAFLEATPSP